MVRNHHLKAQDLITPRAQEYARKTRFEHKQGRVWKIAWSIEDLRTHGFGQHLMGHDLVIFIKGILGHKPIMGRSQLICTEGSLMVTVQYSNDYKDDKNEALHTQYIFRTDVPHGGPVFHAAGTGAITIELAAASAILAKLEAITRQWEVINERLDHMGVPREQVGYPDTHQDEGRRSCELRGKNVIPYTHINVVAVLPSVGVHESSFCDTLDIVRSHEDQTLVVGTQVLVDLLDDEIDSPRENDLCPPGASTYNLTKVSLPSDESIHTLVDPCEKQGESTLVCELPTTSEGEQNDQPGVDDLDLLEYLENPSCDCLCEDDFDCGPLASRDGLHVCEDNSCEKEGDMCLEMPSTSSLYVSYVRHIPSGNFETSSKCMHRNPLFEVDLWNTFLNPLLVHDIFNSDKEGLPNFEDDTLGESESGRDLSPWLRLDLRSNPFQEGKDDTSQMATLIFEDMIGGHHLKAQDLVTLRAQEYARKTRFKHKQGRVWKIAFSIEDLRTHGFGQHLMGHDLVIFIKGILVTSLGPNALHGYPTLYGHCCHFTLSCNRI
ncbi:hypothetical protein FXO37_00981 [Capsicum annuum]|nr:hypothetical protein FXO37_00981 [Capsicum annuum]